MKALSIKQPWAYLIAKGWKDIENRSWKTNYRGRIYIHASMSKTDMNKMPVLDIEHRMSRAGRTFGEIGDFLTAYYAGDLDFGAIIGEVDIVNCIYRFGDENDNLYSPWHERAMYGFVLTNAVMYDKIIPYRGQLGFFEVEVSDEIVRLARGN